MNFVLENLDPRDFYSLMHVAKCWASIIHAIILSAIVSLQWANFYREETWLKNVKSALDNKIESCIPWKWYYSSHKKTMMKSRMEKNIGIRPKILKFIHWVPHEFIIFNVQNDLLVQIIYLNERTRKQKRKRKMYSIIIVWLVENDLCSVWKNWKLLQQTG